MSDRFGILEELIIKGTLWLHHHARLQLQGGSRSNKGHRQSRSAGFSIEACSELEFLLQHLFIAGLDKANNNACHICIYHIRVQALHRLHDKDFLLASLSMADTLLMVEERLLELIPEVQFRIVGLPYLMATYKLCKMKYRWLTNAAGQVGIIPQYAIL